MANSKSNIYPIQLQNAELNLNKFDAEIKQYSGFNKNNAPFIGGCLSNIFIKNETIPGVNDNNVYIDDNSDIYRTEVNTETNTGYLYKNDEVIRTIENFNEVAVEREEVTFDVDKKDIVCVFDEEFYVYRELNYSSSPYYHYKYYVKFYNRFTESWETIYLRRGNNYLENEMKEDESFDLKRITDETSDFYVIGFKGYDYDLGSSVRNAGVKVFYRSEDTNYEADRKTESSSEYTNNLEWPVVVHAAKKANGSNTYSCYLFRNIRGSTVCYRIDFNFTTGVISELINEDTNFYTNNLYRQGDNIYGTVYRVTQTEIFFTGDLSLNYGGSYSRRNNNFTLYAEYYLNSYNKKITFIPHHLFAFNAGDTEYTLIPTNSRFFNFISSYGAIGCLLFKNHTESNETWRQCTFVARNCLPGVSFDDEGIPHFPFGVMLGGHVLLNNEKITGLYHRNCLLTEWNSVKKVYSVDCWYKADIYNDNLFRYSLKNNTFVIYQSNDEKIYKFSKSNKLFIKKVLDLLVMNVCTDKNCFNIKTGNFYNYAPCYNNYVIPFLFRYSTVPNNYGSISFSSDNVNESYLAASINEYNQKYNSSILLNPQPLSIILSVKYYQTVEEVPVDTVALNVYYGTTASIDYIGTQFFRTYNYKQNIFNIDLIKNDSLVGLPFPIDSNGNIEYSPSLFAEIKDVYGNQSFIKDNRTYYPLVVGNDNLPILSYFIASGIEGFEEGFIIQGQFYGILNKGIYNITFYNGVLSNVQFIVSVENLQFCGNTPYEALFYSATNRCLYSFTGANILNQKQFIDKITTIKSYKYNPATQSMFLLTDIGVIISSLFGIYQINMPEAESMFLLKDGVVFSDNEGNYRYIKYYKKDTDENYLKENIKLETCYFGMNNQTVTINDCLYMRLFSEDHEEGELEVSATTLSLHGRKTERTTFKIKKSDWDKETHTIYLRYQPKEQRGLGISFKLNSPFKIASMSVGSQADAILIDRVSKSAIDSPAVKSNSVDW